MNEKVGFIIGKDAVVLSRSEYEELKSHSKILLNTLDKEEVKATALSAFMDELISQIKDATSKILLNTLDKEEVKAAALNAFMDELISQIKDATTPESA